MLIASISIAFSLVAFMPIIFIPIPFSFTSFTSSFASGFAVFIFITFILIIISFSPFRLRDTRGSVSYTRGLVVFTSGGLLPLFRVLTIAIVNKESGS